MVKKLLKFFAYLLFFVLILMVFIPKASVYYLLEENMKKFEIIISKEQLKESLFSLEVQNLEISAKGIESAVVEEADVTLLLFYNSLELKNIQLSSLVETYLPSKIDNIEVSYTIFNPLVVNVVGFGAFGEINAEFDILERNVSANLHPANIMLKRYKKSMKMFKKSEDGVYVYAKSF